MKINERELYDYSLATQVPFMASNHQSNDDFKKTLEVSVETEEKVDETTTVEEDSYERSDATGTRRSGEETGRSDSSEKKTEGDSKVEKREDVKEEKSSESKEKDGEASKESSKESKSNGEETTGNKGAEKTVDKEKVVINLKSEEEKSQVKDQKDVTQEVDVKKDNKELLTEKGVSVEKTESKNPENRTDKFANEMELVEEESNVEESVQANSRSVDKNDSLNGENVLKTEASKVKKSDKAQNDIHITFADSKSESVEKKEGVTQVQSSSKVLEQYEEFREKILKNVENGVKIAINRPEGQVSIKLQPPELGRMDIQLSVKKSGVSAEIMTENPAVKEVILTNLEQLKSNMENANLSVGDIDVSTGDFNRFADQKLEGEGKGNSGKGKGNGAAGNGNEVTDSENQIVNSAPLTQFLGRSLNVLV